MAKCILLYLSYLWRVETVFGKSGDFSKLLHDSVLASYSPRVEVEQEKGKIANR